MFQDYVNYAVIDTFKNKVVAYYVDERNAKKFVEKRNKGYDKTRYIYREINDIEDYEQDEEWFVSF